MKYLFVLLFLIGCSSTDRGQYNIDTFQDPDCYAKYGGEIGYCDKNMSDDENNSINKK